MNQDFFLSDGWVLSGIVFLPLLGALLLTLVPGRQRELAKTISLAATGVVFGLTLILWAFYARQASDPGWPSLAARAAALRPGQPPLDEAVSRQDLVVRVPWIRSFGVEYYLGVDGLNLPLVVLTAFITMLAMLASWTIDRYVRAYCILLLVLEAGMLGTFLALDFFLFYVFWELTLLPMYFLIGLWGAPSRVEADGRIRGGPYAAIKFFIYTLVGSVLMLVALLAFYFYPVGPGERAYTFDLMRLHELGQAGIYGRTFQLIVFALLYVAFAIKVPVFPFHTWLPDAHVEAPTPISMILAGILLKMGGYGFVRIAYPSCPEAAQILAWFLAGIGVWNILYGALVAMAQTDFKKLVAYSSISHMGYVILGFAVWSLAPGFDPNKWSMAMNGAMFQMIAHGISSPGMFFAVGVLYDRIHHRDLSRMGGLANIMPFYAGISAIIFFAGMGLPGLCGFIGEVFTVLGSYQFSRTFAVLAASGVILTAAYILWTLQRVFLGTPRPGLLEGAPPEAHGSERLHIALPDLTVREWICAVPIAAMTIVLGVYPDLLFRLMGMEPSVTALVHALVQAVPAS
jgi:NADH-quinone oxidoreductase subunit M